MSSDYVIALFETYQTYFNEYALIAGTREQVEEIINACDQVPQGSWPVQWNISEYEWFVFDNPEEYKSYWTIKPVSGPTAVEMMIILRNGPGPTSFGNYPAPEFWEDLSIIGERIEEIENPVV